MDRKQVFDKVVSALATQTRNREALASVTELTSVQKDLKVNSARIVDVVLELQEAFSIDMTDEEVDRVRTVGDIVDLVLSKG
jgi:acyl carrier protein